MARPTVRRFLTRGYFPPGLPQAFQSSSFGVAVTKRGLILPPEFLADQQGKYRKALLARHNLARVGQLRRVLSIPNPIHQLNLVTEIVRNWGAIAAHIATDPISITSPIPTSKGDRSIAAIVEHPERPAIRAKKRTGVRYLLCADIQQFFPSIYTHSVPWALHTRAIAKARQRDMTLLGNRLDYWIRQAQDAQTRGIPIGPDTSLVIAEILMTAIDGDLASKGGGLDGFRAVDDFELGFTELSRAEEALTHLQATLDMWELKLNESKTRIVTMPAPFDDLWPVQLRRFDIRGGARTQSSDLVDFFSLAFDLAKSNSTASVLRYALSRTRGIDMLPASWDTYQDILLQCAYAEPGTLPHVTAELVKYKRVGRQLNEAAIRSSMGALIHRHLPLGHGSEVAWALWLCIKTDCALTQAVTDLLPSTTDSLVPLLSLHANQRGILPGQLDTAAWRALMTPDELWGENWLLAYEANVKGWLPSIGQVDHVAATPCFAYLKANNVSFYTSNASPHYVRKWSPKVSPGGTIGSAAALELLEEDF